MKLFFHAGALLLSAFVFMVSAVEPNYVKTTVLGVGQDLEGTNQSTDMVSASYTDGLGRSIQSKVNNTPLKTSDNGVIPNTSKFLTTCTFYDDAGRPVKATLPFEDQTEKYLSVDFNYVNEQLKLQYSQYAPLPDGDPIAYSETKYYDDPVSGVYESAMPGVDNCMGSGGTVKTWTFGVTRTPGNVELILTGGKTVKFMDGFLSTDVTDAHLDEVRTLLLSANTAFPDERTHILNISRSNGGKYSQVLKDLFGRTVATVARKSSADNDFIKSEMSYDILGNILAETPPKDQGNTVLADTKYLYNTLGQVIRKETPDGAIEKYEYNDAGLLYKKNIYYINSSDVESLLHGYAYGYDDFGRLLSVTPIARNASPYVEYFYDNINLLSSRTDITSTPKAVLGNLQNLKGRMVAAVNRYCNGKYQVIDLYSYDNDGNVEDKYKVVPNLPLQRISYSYDIHGKKLTERISVGTVSYVKEYVYDFAGRLKEIRPASEPSKKLATYNYNTFGQLDKKLLDSKIQSDYQYTINSQVKNIANGIYNNGSIPVNRFTENITIKPDGNIKKVDMVYDGYAAAAATINHEYIYDNLQRLTNVASNDSKYNSQYVYDDIGRIKSKVEGTSVNPDYKYYGNTNRLKNVKAASNNQDYIYDVFGNMVLDKTKKMEIVYDWRNLPIEFNFYDDIPGAVSANEKGIFQVGQNVTMLPSYLADQVKNGTIRLLSSVSMLYDADGNRVMKIESE